MDVIFRDHTAEVGKGDLRLREGDTVFLPILLIPLSIPFESGLSHSERLAGTGQDSHTIVWARVPWVPNWGSTIQLQAVCRLLQAALCRQHLPG
jgi:hypothetical protein